MNQQTKLVYDLAEVLQKECHIMTKEIIDNVKGIDVNSASMIFIYKKLAEMHIKIEGLYRLLESQKK